MRWEVLYINRYAPEAANPTQVRSDTSRWIGHPDDTRQMPREKVEPLGIAMGAQKGDYIP